MVSIIIVNYHVKKELFDCIKSIIATRPKASYEIIVVDNDEEKTIETILKNRFPQVLYIKSPVNIGFGAGNNLGEKYARGDYLFFLNPDTTVTKDAIDVLYNFVKNNPSAGMVAPLLFNPQGNVYPFQGSSEYSLISAIVVLSFVNKFFPDNIISRNFFHKRWNKKNIEEFDVVPGTAFMIKKSVFEQAQMFDEKFFLYFEEYDLAKRIRRLGYKNYIIPRAKVLHIWEVSTKKRKDINKIFSKSRYLFFKKHYGIFSAFLIEVFLRIGKYELFLSFILIMSIFLGSFNIRELMTFIGDQGWFYLSARDMLINGNIPLVGIASSRPWLHQGPFWTYLLAPVLWVFNFDPVSGAYITIFLGVLSVFGIYLLGSALFSKKVGLISSLLYTTSPLTVFYMRFPYHTSPIPILTIAFVFSLYKIIQNRIIYIPLSVFLLSILYNFEIATIVLGIILIGVLGYKLFKKSIHLNEILNKKILSLSIIAAILPLLPMILYDVKNGFPQTLKFSVWFFYRIASFFGLNPEHAFSVEKILVIFNFLLTNFTRLIYAPNSIISAIILVTFILWTIYYIFKDKKMNDPYKLILILFYLPLLLIILNQTPSDAYLPVLFPVAILLISVFFDYLTRIKNMFAPVFIFMTVIIFSNIYFMIKNDFEFDRSSDMFTLDKRLGASNKILDMVENKDYNLIGKGLGSEHESFTMNYEYLTWWLGHGPSKNNIDLKIVISESKNGITIKTINK